VALIIIFLAWLVILAHTGSWTLYAFTVLCGVIKLVEMHITE
jgi:hypothetical protein